MKKANAAFTLIELIVSMVLVSIVLLGILSINTVLQNNNVDYGQRYLVKSTTQTTLNHILNNASLAVGNAGTDPTYGLTEEGIVVGAAGTGDPNSFCFHQDIPSGSPLDTTALNNPATLPPAYNNNGSATSSRWLCYTLTGSPTYQISYCSTTYNYAAATGLRGAAKCTIGVGNTQFLGSAYSITPTVNGTPTAPLFSNGTFSIAIQNCLTNTAATCAAGLDQANNPEVVIPGSVTPSQDSV